MYREEYHDIFPKFKITYTPADPRQLPPLRTRDLFEIIEKLFATRKKFLVHIAIDFLLIFQSGQRSASDQKNIEAGVADLLQKRKYHAKLA